jgi:hypothetical protein
MVEVLALQLNTSITSDFSCKKPTILLHEKSEIIGAFGGGWVLAPQYKLTAWCKKPTTLPHKKSQICGWFWWGRNLKLVGGFGAKLGTWTPTQNVNLSQKTYKTFP